jgi:hypothetical protein
MEDATPLHLRVNILREEMHTQGTIGCRNKVNVNDQFSSKLSSPGKFNQISNARAH